MSMTSLAISSARRVFCCSDLPGHNFTITCGIVVSLWTQKRLDRPPLVHCTVALRDALEGQGQVEHLAGIDFPVPDQIDQLGQEAAHRCGTAVKVDVAEEQVLSFELDPVGDPD